MQLANTNNLKLLAPQITTYTIHQPISYGGTTPNMILLRHWVLWFFCFFGSILCKNKM